MSPSKRKSDTAAMKDLFRDSNEKRKNLTEMNDINEALGGLDDVKGSDENDENDENNGGSNDDGGGGVEEKKKKSSRRDSDEEDGIIIIE
jgi:hypothetical protein